METIKDKCAIVGIGETEYSKDSGRSELSLVLEASMKAIDDAGLQPEDIDGMVRFVVDPTPEEEVIASLGIPELTFFDELAYTGTAAGGLVAHACMAVASWLGQQRPPLPGHEWPVRQTLRLRCHNRPSRPRASRHSWNPSASSSPASS